MCPSYNLQSGISMNVQSLRETTLILPRIARTFAEAVSHQWHDKGHATQPNRSLHHTTCAIRFLMRLDICSMLRLTQHRDAATLHVFASWHTTQRGRKKGRKQRLGKSGRIYLKGYPDPADECESSAGAAIEPLRCRTIDYNSHS